MPQEAINATLDLEGLEVLGIATFEQLIEVVVESRFDAGSCRSCGGIAAEPKERPEVLVRDLPMCGRPVVLRCGMPKDLRIPAQSRRATFL